jgi:hypothetical protein
MFFLDLDFLFKFFLLSSDKVDKNTLLRSDVNPVLPSVFFGRAFGLDFESLDLSIEILSYSFFSSAFLGTSHSI